MEAYIILQEVNGRNKVVGAGHCVWSDIETAKRKYARICRFWDEHDKSTKYPDILKVKKPKMMKITIDPVEWTPSDFTK